VRTGSSPPPRPSGTPPVVRNGSSDPPRPSGTPPNGGRNSIFLECFLPHRGRCRAVTERGSYKKKDLHKQVLSYNVQNSASRIYISYPEYWRSYEEPRKLHMFLSPGK